MTDADNARDLAFTAEHARDAAFAHDDAAPARWPGKRTRTASLDRSDRRIADLRTVRAEASSIRGSGPLPAQLAAEFGALLGVDLGDVRVHHGGAAGDQADELDAHAVTHGSEIALSGSLDPDSAFGRHVVAHELVHVAQSKRGSHATGLAAHAIAGPSDAPHEQEAEAGAAALLAGQPFAVRTHGALPLVSRFQRGAGKRSPEPGPSPGPSGAPAGPSRAPSQGKSPPGVSQVPSGAPPSTRAPSSVPARGPSKAPSAPAQKKDLDALVKAELEKRADPTLKAEYAKGVSQIDILRIQALQYTFQATGFWHIFVETVWPWTSFVDHGHQIYSTNAYRGGHSCIDKVQFVIESARGVLHLLGDVASMISAWAGLFSLIMGAIALVGSETVILGVGAGALSAIGAEIAVIAAGIKLLADFIDTLLGALQMVILIIRARNSKDPNERARFAQLLHKEVNDFATNLVSMGVQVVVMGLTAGVAAGFSKGLTRAALGETRGQFANLFRPVRHPLQIPATLRKTFARADVGKKVTVGGKTLTGTSVERRPMLIEAEEGMLEISEQVRVKKLVEIKKTGKWVEMEVATNQKRWVPFVPGKNSFGQQQTRVNTAGIKRAVRVDLIATGVAFKFGWLQAEAQGPRDPTSPSAQPGSPDRGGTSSDLSTVDVWPSQIDAFERAKGPLGGAIGHSDRQYDRAASQAGGDLAAKVGAVFGASKDKAGKTRYLGLQVKSDATEGQATAERGAATAGQGRDAQNQAIDKKNQVDDSARKIGNEGQKLEPPKPKGGNILDKIKEWTIGKLGSLIGKAQKWVANFVGKCVMKWAGFSKEELDLAGIENDMREDSKKDKTAEQQGGESALAADQIEQEVYKLQENKKRDEQYAIQGMVDAQSFIMALTEADQLLGDSIAGGQAYLDVITPLIRHELETKAEGKAIDEAYLVPVKTFATTFVASLPQWNFGSRARGDGLAELSDMKSAIPALDIGPGQAVINQVAGQYDAAFAELAGAARDNTALFQGVLPQFIGTTDYDGVHENAKGLDRIAEQFDRGAAQLADQVFTAVNSVIDAYVQHIKAAFDEANRTPPDPPPGSGPGGSQGGNAEDDPDPGSERPGGR
jgi:hypothetical protein